MQGKWISDLTPETSVADAARRVLTFRLESVRDCLGRALREEKHLTEHIHDLRVATRRAGAALDVFSECLPGKVYKAARRQLRSLRCAAGEARDWDVLISRLMKEAVEQSAEDRAGTDMLIGYAMAHRIPAQTQLELASPNYPFGFERFMAATLGAIRYKGLEKTTLPGFARPLLAEMFERLNKNVACEHSNNYEQLHNIRIAGKRLRYAMEIFVDCFGPSLRRHVCPALADMQQILGDVNDHYTATRRYALLDEKLRVCLPKGYSRYQTEIARLVKHHETGMSVGQNRFHGWRELWQGAEIQVAIAEICSTPATSSHRLLRVDDQRVYQPQSCDSSADEYCEASAERIA
jgi:CHAD domain-containing protein